MITMDKTRLVIAIVILIVLGLLTYFFIFNKGMINKNGEIPQRVFSKEELNDALERLTASSTISIISPEVEKTALEKLTAPIK
ncbi:MAG: hypothetical protein AAB484_02455 [Patescibacteria group bacterium]